MRALHMPGIEQTSMTYDQNKSRCESASTGRYDYHEEFCPTCRNKDKEKEKESVEKIDKKELRAIERAKLLKRDYDHRQNIDRDQAKIAQIYEEIERKLKKARDKEAIRVRESAERQ
jgi:hypothetical protein